MITCLIWIVVLVVIVGVLVWAMKSLPIDPTIQQIGKVCVVVIFVIAMIYIVLNCVGFAGHTPLGRHF